MIEDVSVSASLAPTALLVQDVGVSAKRDRRRFTAAYKLKILQEVERCRAPGEVGALLRREGLYSSHLASWRAARRRGELAGLAQRRGPKPAPPDPRAKRIAELERQLARVTARAERAEAIVEVQKKVSQLLGIALPASDEPGERRR